MLSTSEGSSVPEPMDNSELSVALGSDIDSAELSCASEEVIAIDCPVKSSVVLSIKCSGEYLGLSIGLSGDVGESLVGEIDVGEDGEGGEMEVVVGLVTLVLLIGEVGE